MRDERRREETSLCLLSSLIPHPFRRRGAVVSFFVADPEWGSWIIAYFFLGGIAAGSYFIAILIEWFGSKEDQAVGRIAYWIAFPLVLLCALFLTIDLERPERFWHMLLASE